MAAWPVFLINLERDVKRLEAATAELRRHDQTWIRVPAVNGRQLPPDRIARSYDPRGNAKHAKHPMTAPEIGCYLSHFKAWEKIVESGAPGGVVFEDDFTITGDLSAARLGLAADEGRWDMVKLFSLRPDSKLLRPRRLIGDVVIGEPYRIPTMMLGYALRRQAAERLVAQTLPFMRPVDEDMKFFWEKGLTITEIRPAPIALGNQVSAEQTVGQSRRSAVQDDPRSALKRAGKGLSYRLNYLFQLHRRRLLP